MSHHVQDNRWTCPHLAVGPIRNDERLPQGIRVGSFVNTNSFPGGTCTLRTKCRIDVAHTCVLLVFV